MYLLILRFDGCLQQVQLSCQSALLLLHFRILLLQRGQLHVRGFEHHA